MAKLTLDKIEKYLDKHYSLEEFPVDGNNEFTAAAMYDKYALGLEAQAERWVIAHAQLQGYAAVVSPKYVSEQEAATLREVLGKTLQLAKFAVAQPAAAREAAKLVHDVCERVAAKGESAVDAREAMKDRILAFAAPLVEDFPAVEKLYASLDLDELAACVPASFYDTITAAFIDDDSDKCWLICGGELYSPASAILVHLFWDDEIETFMPSEEQEDDDDDDEPDDEEPEEEDEEPEEAEDEPDEDEEPEEDEPDEEE